MMKVHRKMKMRLELLEGHMSVDMLDENQTVDMVKDLVVHLDLNLLGWLPYYMEIKLLSCLYEPNC